MKYYKLWYWLGMTAIAIFAIWSKGGIGNIWNAAGA